MGGGEPDCIEICGLRVLGRHGVLAEEQARPQPFVVDLTIRLDTSAAQESDDLADTVDYASVAQHVAALVARERWNLLERLAARICEAVMSDARVAAVSVRVAKPKAPLGVDADAVAVRVARVRET
ncbi:MAG: dihydroneopterin aldolase [Acidimicrobiia bacterium]|nr:dihydroneopterin aldolase [Acidimicrobiia bacterium]